jgi:2-polyprenyl-3-methyl-5-hydroxy-6-metoxy-1,4-benzoquinol methylase
MFRACHALVSHLPGFVRSAHSAVWLRALDSDDLQAITLHSYSNEAGTGFETEEHNLANAWPWELASFDALFTGSREIIVAAAGGGREMIELARRGHRVTGFDAAPDLVEAARRNLARAGVAGTMLHAGAAQVPELAREFDGLVLGRGFYHHLPGRGLRIGFLRACRECLRPGAPVFIGDFKLHRDADAPSGPGGDAPWARGNAVGDSFFHYFTADELHDEIGAAGFEEIELHEAGLPGVRMGYAIARAGARPTAP